MRVYNLMFYKFVFFFSPKLLRFLHSSIQYSSVAQSCPTLWLYKPQHVSPPCPSPTPRVHPNPCPLIQWCHPTISFSVVPFSCPQSFPASWSFQMSQLFTSGGQIIGVSVSASIIPMNIQDWFPLEWSGLDILADQGTLKSLLQHHSSRASILGYSAFIIWSNSHIHTWLLEKP